MKQITIGITAHVDSGKTTLSEALLYLTGEIRKQGRVDNKNSALDTNSIERDRGITVFAHQAQIKLNDLNLTLLDTPGHIDFSAETERTFQVLDYAVLVISGTDGVQSHTETIWRLLEMYNIPTFIFVNKMDMNGADKEKVLLDLTNHLSSSCVDFSVDRTTSDFYESCAMCSENAMEEFLSYKKLSHSEIAGAILNREIFPVSFGSALKLSGVDDFISVIEEYSCEPERQEIFGGKIYKISTDEKGKRVTNLKITGGQLSVRDSIEYETQDGEKLSEKISEIRFYQGEKFHNEATATAGLCCAVTGLSKTYAGQGIGKTDNSESPFLEPVMTYAVKLPKGTDAFTMLKNLHLLEEEDPALHVLWNEQLKEIHVQLMGEVQLEVLRRIIFERFNIEVEFGQGKIAYKETIENAVEGVGHYEPLCHYAEVHLVLEPLERGSGLQFEMDCREDDLDKNWQRLILTHLWEKTHIGVLTGSPVTDMKITLVAGKAHLKHTEGGDFRQATYRAVRQGLKQAKSVLLEPLYDFRLEVPDECVGRAMTDIGQMNGKLSPPQKFGEYTLLTGFASAEKLSGYAQEVTGYTKGRGRISFSVRGYGKCADSDRIISQIGYNCDADLNNTADSVFCANGTGFTVKWQNVKNYMHIPSAFKTHVQTENKILSYERAKTYVEKAVEDKELMEIFERTYGTVNRDPRKAFKTVKKPKVVYKGTRSVQHNGPEYVVVDGYNIIFSWEELKKLAKDNLDAARSQLINRLCNYRGYKGCELILVFDAYKVKGADREIELHSGISVVYTKESETADTYIERVTHTLAKHSKVRVATSDGLEQVIILGNGALRVPSEEFHEEVKNCEKAIRDFLDLM